MHHLAPKEYNGVISVKRKGKIIIEEAFGYADLPNKLPNRLDTIFVTALAGKIFTATGILKLIEQGKLKFESTIGDLLTFDLKQIDPAITVRQLLTHTSVSYKFERSKTNASTSIRRLCREWTILPERNTHPPIWAVSCCVDGA